MMKKLLLFLFVALNLTVHAQTITIGGKVYTRVDGRFVYSKIGVQGGNGYLFVPLDTVAEAPAGSVAVLHDTSFYIKGPVKWSKAAGGTGSGFTPPGGSTKVLKGDGDTSSLRTVNGQSLFGSTNLVISGSVLLDSARKANQFSIKSSSTDSTTILSADTIRAGALSASDKKKLDRIEVLNNMTELRAITSPQITSIYRFTYNRTIGDFYWDPTSTATDDSVMIVKVPSITTGRFKRYFETYLNVRWFGALGDASTDDYVAMQKAIFVITKSQGIYPSVLYFPPGNYRTSKPLICANLDIATHRYLQTTILLRGDPGGTRLGSQPTTIVGYSSAVANSFVICFQLCKSGGIEGIAIYGPYTPPTLSDSAFHGKDITEYNALISGVRISQFSPSGLVMVDPFIGSFTPADGGYPGLTSWYTDASSQPFPTSGSTGLSFKDISLRNGYIGLGYSVNGTTQNGEDMTVDGAIMLDCAIGFQSCQTEEKANLYYNIMAWGGCHTVLNNRGFGQQGPGQIYAQNIQMAGRNNRFLTWDVGGYTGSYFNNIYSESLGRFGALTGNFGVQAAVTNSLFNLATPDETQFKMVDWHIYATDEITFQNCQIRMYGTGIPIFIRGGASYQNCTFETAPAIQPSSTINSGHPDPQFVNCFTTVYGGPNRLLGKTGMVYGQASILHSYNAYGNFNFADESNQPYGTFFGYNVKNERLLDYAIAGSTTSITVTSSRKIYLPHSAAMYVGQPLQVLQTTGTFTLFAGIVTSIGAGGDTISYVPRGVETGTVTFIYPFYRRLGGFFGNTTSGSPYIKKVIHEALEVYVGDYYYAPAFSGLVKVDSIMGDTIKVSGNAAYTTTGSIFRTEGVSKYWQQKLSNIDAITSMPNNLPFAKGDTFEDYYQGIHHKYLITQDGVINATGSETRLAKYKEIYDTTLYATQKALVDSATAIRAASGGAGSGLSGTINKLVKFASGGATGVNSSITDDGTTVATSEQLVVSNGISTGGSSAGIAIGARSGGNVWALYSPTGEVLFADASNGFQSAFTLSAGASGAILFPDAGRDIIMGGSGATPTAKLHVVGSAGANHGIKLELGANSGTPSLSYCPVEFTVPTTGLTGQIVAFAHNYVNSGVDASADGIMLNALATGAQLSLLASDAAGSVSIGAGGVDAAHRRILVNTTGIHLPAIVSGINADSNLVVHNGYIEKVKSGWVDTTGTAFTTYVANHAGAGGSDSTLRIDTTTIDGVGLARHPGVGGAKDTLYVKNDSAAVHAATLAMKVGSMAAPNATSTANGADITGGVLTLHYGGANPGIMKLYSVTGSNTDGTMSQQAIGTYVEKAAGFYFYNITAAGAVGAILQAKNAYVTVDPASAIGTTSITTPASPNGGDMITVLFGGQIAAGSPVCSGFTITANSGQSIYGFTFPMVTVGNDALVLIYDITATKWRRIKP